MEGLAAKEAHVIRKLLPARVAPAGFSMPGRVIRTTPPPGGWKHPERRLRLIITATAPDRDKEVVVASGAHVEDFAANPIVLFSHMTTEPVANATELVLREDEIEAEIEFFQPDESPKAQELFLLYSRGKMRAASIGFLPISVTDRKLVEGQEGRAFLEWELLEFSLVAIPSLPEALVISERELVLAHAKALGSSWRPARGRDVREEFKDTLAMLSGMLDQVRYGLAAEACDRAIILLDVMAIEEELYGGGWR